MRARPRVRPPRRRTPRLFCLHQPAPPQIYTLSLHDALPIFASRQFFAGPAGKSVGSADSGRSRFTEMGSDRKSTRLNSSHLGISYAVFCLKKKTIMTRIRRRVAAQVYFHEDDDHVVTPLASR